MKETREFTLINKYGLHVRPAGLFAKIASRYDERPFKADAPVALVSNVVWYALAGLLKDIDKREEGWQDAYEEAARAYLNMMHRISYK